MPLLRRALAEAWATRLLWVARAGTQRARYVMIQSASPIIIRSGSRRPMLSADNRTLVSTITERPFCTPKPASRALGRREPWPKRAVLHGDPALRHLRRSARLPVAVVLSP
jgi:hypothetical protein